MQRFIVTALLVACSGSAWAQQRSPASMHPFKNRLYDQIGAAWYRAVEANSKNIAVGKVRVAVTMLSDGKITQLRVVSNTSNELFARICVSAIQETKIPSVPTELLTHGKFEDEISFEMFAN